MSGVRDVLAALHAALAGDKTLAAGLPGGIGDGGPGTRPMPSLTRIAVESRPGPGGDEHLIVYRLAGPAGSEARLLTLAERMVAVCTGVSTRPSEPRLGLLNHSGTITLRTRQGRVILVDVRFRAITE